MEQLSGSSEYSDANTIVLPLRRLGRAPEIRGEIEDSFFKRFSYDQTDKDNAWRFDQQKKLSSEYKEGLAKPRLRDRSIPTSISKLEEYIEKNQREFLDRSHKKLVQLDLNLKQHQQWREQDAVRSLKKHLKSSAETPY